MNAINTDAVNPSVVDTTVDQQTEVVENNIDQKTQEISQETLKKKNLEQEQQEATESSDADSSLTEAPQKV